MQFAVQTKLPGSDLPTHFCTIRDARYRLSMFQGVDWRELYDLHTDPSEIKNLWDDSAHAKIRASLTERLISYSFAHIDSVPTFV